MNYSSAVSFHVIVKQVKPLFKQLYDKKIKEKTGKIMEICPEAGHTGHVLQEGHIVTETSCFPYCYHSGQLLLSPSVHNMNTSTCTQHEHTYATGTQAHVRNMNSST